MSYTNQEKLQMRIPIDVECSSISQLDDILQLSSNTLFIVSEASGNEIESWKSKKINFDKLVSGLSNSLSLDNINLSIGTLSDAITKPEYTIYCNLDHPYIISSITESHGVITNVDGYRLSDAIFKDLSDIIDNEIEKEIKSGLSNEVSTLVDMSSFFEDGIKLAEFKSGAKTVNIYAPNMKQTEQISVVFQDQYDSVMSSDLSDYIISSGIMFFTKERPQYTDEYWDQYLRIVAETDNVNVKVIGSNLQSYNLQYNTDTKESNNWIDIVANDYIDINLNTNDTIRFRVKIGYTNQSIFKSYLDNVNIQVTGGVAKQEGNIQTLLKYDGYVNEYGISAFSGLFKDSEALTSVIDINSSPISEYCYSRMFMNCKNIANVILNPMILSDGCFNEMFSNCSSLTSLEVSFNSFGEDDSQYTLSWLSNLDTIDNRYFICNSSLSTTLMNTRTISTVPSNWKIQYRNDGENIGGNV